MVSLAPAIGVQLALDRLLRISPLAALVVGIVCGAGCFVWLSRAGRGS
jgi:hypothetical protein